MFLANNQPLSKIFMEFSIAEPKKIRMIKQWETLNLD